MRRAFLSLIALAIPALAGEVRADSWVIDGSHSTVQFSVRHMMVTNVRGEFGKVSGTVEMDENDMTRSSIQVTIDATTINTREQRRDDHLRSADFFDVAQHPKIEFKSRQVTRAGDGYKVIGDLTLRGVTREVVLDVEGPTPAIKDQRGSLRKGASATTKIQRKDFGLTWNRALDSGGVVVGDEVKIQIDVELIQRANPAG